MSEQEPGGLARRVVDRLALAWDDSRVAGVPPHENPYAADAGETPFVPMRLSDAGARFPPTTRYPTIASIEQRLGSSATKIRLAAGAWMPTDAAGVAPLLESAVDWGRALAPGEYLYCVQPLSNNFVLASEELEQIVGLAGGVEFVEETATRDGARCLVAGVTVRHRACAIVLAWPADLVSDPVRLDAALNHLALMPECVRAAAHVIDSPARPDDAWRTGALRLASAIADEPSAILGARVTAPSLDAAALAAVIDRVPAVRGRLAVQWVRRDRADGLAAPAAPVAPGITCDCSLDVDDAEPSRPYVTLGAYVPADFDVRVPAFSDRHDALTQIPRIDGRLIPPRRLRGWSRTTMSPEREADRAFRDLLDRPIDERAARLRTVLDLDRRRAYLQRLETDRGEVARWHEYHVYNWPAPPPAILRLVAYDAADLDRRESALRALQDLRPTTTIVTGEELVARARAMAADAVRTAARIRAQQIAAHGYLASGGRAELTADSEQLIARLPSSLGSTLEIGFGYALTARRIATRATRYIGIDLQTEQARVLRESGGHGLVADLQALPLADGSFDTVIADNVLEHASSPLDALAELRRVLAPRGRVYALIPLDASTSAFQIRTHLWKADVASIRRAAALTGFRIVDLDVLEYAALAVYGCFPASAGRTCLAIFEPMAIAERRIAG
jgi:SAM-dependent methyltransferase